MRNFNTICIIMCDIHRLLYIASDHLPKRTTEGSNEKSREKDKLKTMRTNGPNKTKNRMIQ